MQTYESIEVIYVNIHNRYKMTLDLPMLCLSAFHTFFFFVFWFLLLLQLMLRIKVSSLVILLSLLSSAHMFHIKSISERHVITKKVKYRNSILFST